METTIAENLLSAYRWNRAAATVKLYPRPKGSMATASEAIERARFDIAANRKRYSDGPWAKPHPAVSWQPVKPRSSERLAYVEKPESIGLRHVGDVEAECGGRNGYFSKRGSCGWFTDPYGDVFKDRMGLCWGVVYQLPARDGRARFLAGYQFGGVDGGPCVDFGTIYEEDRRDGYYSESAEDFEAARDAANAADSMAQEAAEKEREYQTAWAAGNLYGECLNELAENRKSALQTIREMKGACALVRQLPAALQKAIRAAIENALEERADIFAKMHKLAEGEFPHLHFYPEDRARAAFNEAAGKAVI